MKRGTQNFEEDGRGGVERGGAHQLPEIGKIHFAKHLSIVCCPVVHSMDGWMDGQVSVHVDEPCQIDGLTVETFAVDAAADDVDNDNNDDGNDDDADAGVDDEYYGDGDDYDEDNS